MLPQHDFERLQRAASDQHATMSAVLRVALRDWLGKNAEGTT